MSVGMRILRLRCVLRCSSRKRCSCLLAHFSLCYCSRTMCRQEHILWNSLVSSSFFGKRPISSISLSNRRQMKYTSFIFMSFLSTSISSKRSVSLLLSKAAISSCSRPSSWTSWELEHDKFSLSQRINSALLRLSSSYRLLRMGASSSLILSWSDLGIIQGSWSSCEMVCCLVGAASESCRLLMMSMMLMQDSTFLKFLSRLFMRFSCGRVCLFFIISNLQYSWAKFSCLTSRHCCSFCSLTSLRMCSQRFLSVMMEEQQNQNRQHHSRTHLLSDSLSTVEINLYRMNSSATTTPRCLFQIYSPYRLTKSYSYASLSRVSALGNVKMLDRRATRVSSGQVLRRCSFFRCGLDSNKKRKNA